jgi:hypothetical protein
MNENNLDVEIKILRSWKRLSGGYDAIAKKVNYEIAKLGEDGTFGDLKGIDKKLRLTRGTSFEMSGMVDWYAFEEN